MMRMCSAMASALLLAATLTASESVPPTVRLIRAYGAADELRPPIVVITADNSIAEPSIASRFATVEFDVAASNIPNVYIRLQHCTADWQETENGFLNDVTNRSSLIDWTIAPARSRYYSYRGKVRVPNEQISIRFPGNWKVRLYDLDRDSLLAETRIFVVLPLAEVRVNFMTDFYEPTSKVSSIAIALETIVRVDPGRLIGNTVHTAVTYRTHRWFEPMMVSDRLRGTSNPPSASTNTLGMLTGGKVFRINGIPAENDYRILDVTSSGLFPSTGQPVRMPMSDQRRNGNFIQRADDGAMITTNISSVDDEYVPIEFLLDPTPGRASARDVFVVGSFNNWKPDRTWQMYFDDDVRLYRLRQWVRRARHNYMYATGTLVADDGTVRDVNFEEFEGNTASAGHGFVSFVYAQMQEYGGYDGLIGVATSNIFQSTR